jgi:predicted GIY-YIG superfamily endonuclease
VVKKINLNVIRIDGGTQRHRNYVVEFADGVCKVGVTTRPAQRIRELQRARGARAVRCMLAPATDRVTAFNLERELCALTRHAGLAGTREWRKPGEWQFGYLRQTTGMFWHLIARAPYSPEVIEL